MFRIDTATKQIDKFGAGKHGFKDGNPGAGTPATALTAKHFDHMQEEIARVVEAAGIALDEAQYDQLLKALYKLPMKNMQALSASGNFAVPANVTRVFVKCWGGGGGASGASGGSGAGGGYCEGFVDVTPAQIIAVTVGAGGSGASSGGTAGNGGTSSFGAFMSALGGGGAAVAGGAGGGATGGTLNLTGGDGDDLGGGGAASVEGGAGAGSGGAGGSGRDLGSGGGGNGKGPGGGGGAHTSYALGGNGAAGLVVVYW